MANAQGTPSRPLDIIIGHAPSGAVVCAPGGAVDAPACELEKWGRWPTLAKIKPE